MATEESTNAVESQEPLEGTLVRSKHWHAYQLKMAGLSLPEIADRLGYHSTSAVAKGIKDEIISAAKDIPEEDRDTILALEVDRLNFAQARIWPQVEYGDPKAIDILLKIINLRARLRGLDLVDPTAGTHTVLVIGGQEQEYIAKLKQIASDG